MTAPQAHLRRKTKSPFIYRTGMRFVYVPGNHNRVYYLPHTITLSDPCTLIVCLQVFNSPL